MIYITGDIHGKPERLERNNLASKGLAIGEGDYVIICGDFGLIWNPAKTDEEKWLQWLDQQPFTTLFVDGNHENFDLLNAMAVTEWHGGKVHQIRQNIYHLMRGEIFTIEGKSFFCFGGAKSTDKAFRKPHLSWWPQEEATVDDLDNATNHLTEYDFTVDYVITHTAPRRFLEIQCPDDLVYTEDCMTSTVLTGLEPLITYKRWYFGHFHQDYYQKESKAAWMYRDIIAVE